LRDFEDVLIDELLRHSKSLEENNQNGRTFLNKEEYKLKEKKGNGTRVSVNYSSIWEGGCSFKVLIRTTTDQSSFLCLALEAAVLVYSKRIA
jgi:hypothetical protein